MNVREPELITLATSKRKQATLLLETQYNLSEQGLKTPDRQPHDQRAPLMWGDAWDASFPAVSFPEVHSTGFKTNGFSGIKATIWETLGCNLYSSKNSSLMNPSVICPVQNSDFLLVWRPFCRLHVCTCMYRLLREIKSFLFGRRIEHGQAALAISSFSCGSSCVQQLNQLFLHSSCSGQNNLEIHHLAQSSTLWLYDPPAEKWGKGRMTKSSPK